MAHHRSGLRGLGESEAAVDGYGKDDQAEDLRQLLDQLEATAPVRLVGHDIGGMVAFSFARLHPNRVALLALLDLALPGLGLEQAMDAANAVCGTSGFSCSPTSPPCSSPGTRTSSSAGGSPTRPAAPTLCGQTWWPSTRAPTRAASVWKRASGVTARC